MSVGIDVEISMLLLLKMAVKRLLNKDQVDKKLLLKILQDAGQQTIETQAALLVEALQPIRSCPKCPAPLTDGGYLLGYHQKDCPYSEVSAFGEVEATWAGVTTDNIGKIIVPLPNHLLFENQHDYEEIENFFSEEASMSEHYGTCTLSELIAAVDDINEAKNFVDSDVGVEMGIHLEILPPYAQIAIGDYTLWDNDEEDRTNDDDDKLEPLVSLLERNLTEYRNALTHLVRAVRKVQGIEK